MDNSEQGPKLYYLHPQICSFSSIRLITTVHPVTPETFPGFTFNSSLLHSYYHLHQQLWLVGFTPNKSHFISSHSYISCILVDCFLGGLSPLLAFLNSSLYTVTEKVYFKTQIWLCDFPAKNLLVAPLLAHKALYYLTCASFLPHISDSWASCSSQSKPLLVS